MGRLLVDTFKREHIHMLDKREKDTFVADLIINAACNLEKSATLVLIDSDDMRIVFMGGIFEQWNGVGEAWMLASDKMQKYSKTSFAMIKRFLAVVSMQLNLHRVQCTVEKGFPRYQVFAERMGFVCEGLMQKYGPNGEDHYRYGKVL